MRVSGWGVGLGSNPTFCVTIPDGSVVKNPSANGGDVDLIPGSGRSPGEGNGNPSQYPCLENPWTEEPGGLQSMKSQRVRHDLVTKRQQPRSNEWVVPKPRTHTGYMVGTAGLSISVFLLPALSQALPPTGRLPVIATSALNTGPIVFSSFLILKCFLLPQPFLPYPLSLAPLIWLSFYFTFNSPCTWLLCLFEGFI